MKIAGIIANEYGDLCWMQKKIQRVQETVLAINVRLSPVMLRPRPPPKAIKRLFSCLIRLPLLKQPFAARCILWHLIATMEPADLSGLATTGRSTEDAAIDDVH